jgi:hypothetical protein
MTDTKQRPDGASALVHFVGKGFRRAKLIAAYTIGGLLAVAILTTIMGGSNDAAFLAIAIVVGAEIGLRRYEKKRMAASKGNRHRSTARDGHNYIKESGL